jgi:hypothetical protein
MVTLTIDPVSGPGVEPSCLGINDETGAEIGDASVVANTVMGG